MSLFRGVFASDHFQGIRSKRDEEGLTTIRLSVPTNFVIDNAWPMMPRPVQYFEMSEILDHASDGCYRSVLDMLVLLFFGDGERKQARVEKKKKCP